MAFDEIDELGSSLLQRQRTTRKRTQKRIDKDQRNAMWLKGAGVGVGLVNNYLKEKAANFINNNEELMGQRLIYLKQLQNKERIVDEYGEAIAYPTGVEGWLAEKKFAPIILANFQRDYSTKSSSQRDLNNLVLEQSREAAREHKDNFEKAYEAALQMEPIEKYDAYISSRDGRAENVGGLIFNSLSRMFNDRTQADIDQEMIQSIRNNRFGKNATQLAHFDSLIKDGVSARDAIDLTYTGTNRLKTLKDWGIEEAETILSRITPVTKTFHRWGREYTIGLMQRDYTNQESGELVSSTLGPQMIELANGEIVPGGNTELFNLWAGLPENQAVLPDPADTTGDAIAYAAYVERMIETDQWRMNKVPIETKEIADGDWYGREATDYTYEYVNKLGERMHTVTTRVFDQPATPFLKAASVPTQAAEDQESLLLRLLTTTALPDSDKTAAQADLLLLSFFGSRDVMDEKVKAGVTIGPLLAEHKSVLGRASAIWAKDIEEQYPDISYYQATQLAAQGIIVPLVYSYDEDSESIVIQENYFHFKRSPAINILLAESMLSTGSTASKGIDTHWAGITPRTSEKMAFDAFNELKNLETGGPGETNFYKERAVYWLRRVKGFEDIVVRASTLDKDPEPNSGNVNPFDALINDGFYPTNWKEYINVRGTNNEASVDPGVFTFENLINFEMGDEPSRTEEVPGADGDDDVSTRTRPPSVQDFAGTIFVGNLNRDEIQSLTAIGIRSRAYINPEERLREYREDLQKAIDNLNTNPDNQRFINKVRMFARNIEKFKFAFKNYLDEEERNIADPSDRGSEGGRVRRAEGGPSN